jgi:NodT family efflux transporter outer membrane factor (OMF) lipoprotein
MPLAIFAMAVAISVAGCTSPRDYIHNCFKVGPDVCIPQGKTASHWIEDTDKRVRPECAEVAQWWTVFQDPTLDRLIANASSQNLSLREAGFRVLEARAQLGISKGNLFPQEQSVNGAYQRLAVTKDWNYAPDVYQQFFDQWGLGFNLSWELDLWGRLRRAIAADEYTLQASCANYDDVLVTLLGDVASNYVQVRTLQHRIELTKANVELQSRVFDIAEKRHKAGKKNELDSHQARSNLAQTQSQIPQLNMAIRRACDRLCVLLGMPPAALEQELGEGSIPTAPANIAIGIPAELLRRRPDVRKAEFVAAAQGERIGIAEAELYPMFGIGGTLGWQSTNLPTLFTSDSLNSGVGPWFHWNILNYGRIRNNVKVQDAKFWQAVMSYQNTVLRANAEVEDGLAMFFRAQERTALLSTSVDSSKRAVDIVVKEYQVGTSDFNRVTLIEQNLVQQQDLQAQSAGEIAQGLIQVYRALGGGWQIGPVPTPTASSNAPMPAIPVPDESAPTPAPGAMKAPLPMEPQVVSKAKALPAATASKPVKMAAVATSAKVATRSVPSHVAADAPMAPMPPTPAAPSIETDMAPFPPAPASSGSATALTAGLGRLER